MSEFVKMLLALSLSGTLLLSATLILKKFYKNLFSRCWQYYILLLVAARFLLPVVFDYNITGYLYGMAVNAWQDNMPDETVTDVKSTTNIKETKEIKKVNGIKETQTDIKNNIKQDIKNTAKNIPFYSYLLSGIKGIYKYCFYIWLIPAVVLIVHKISVYRGFINYICVAGTPVQDIATLNLLAECGEKLGIKKAVELYCSPAVSSPVLAGFFRPYIIIPASHIEDKKLFYVFLHELVHYKRRDIFYKWFIQIIICVHWFNPFTRLLSKEVNKACELSCDEAVISMLDKNERRVYGDTLLSFVQTKETYKNPLGTVTLTEGAKQLKERLGAIMYFKKKSAIIKIATVIATIIICFNFLAAGAYAARNRQDSTEVIKNTDNIKNKEDINLRGDNRLISYRQRGFYCGPYIFEMGWDLREEEEKLYSYKAKVILDDDSEIIVHFDDKIKKYCKDKEVLNAAGRLVSSIKKNNNIIKIPLVTRVTYVKPEDIPDYAEKYYKKGDLIGFTALFPELSKEERSRYLNKMYNSDNRIAFFASVTENIDRDLFLAYLDKSSEGTKKVNFFSVLASYAKYEDLKHYIKKSYKSGDTARFAILLDYMSLKDKKKWLAKAKKDKKTAFCAILTDK